MPDEFAAPAAPAQIEAPSAPTTQSAVHAAVTSGDTGAYRHAKRAERAGTPLPDVPLAAAPAADPSRATDPAAPTDPASPTPAPERKVSQRQQQINDYERRIAEQDQRIRALEAQTTPRPADAPRTDPADPPAWKKYAAMPDAPKLAQFESMEEHAAAMALFVGDQRDRERAATQDADQAQATHRARIEQFDARVQALAADDPTIPERIGAVASRIARAGGPYQIVANLALGATDGSGAEVLRHFADHPDALDELVKVPAHLASLPRAVQVREHVQWLVKAFGRLEGTLARPATPPAPAPNPLTAAPAAAKTLGRNPAEATDPKASAIRSHDTRAYRQIRRQERRAAMGR